MKRPKSEWGFSELLKTQPYGVTRKVIKLDEEIIILQLIHRNGMDPNAVDAISVWARGLKRQLPSNVLMIVTSEDLKLEVHRPKKVHLYDSTITAKETSLQDLVEKLDDKNVNVTLRNCHITIGEEDKIT